MTFCLSAYDLALLQMRPQTTETNLIIDQLSQQHNQGMAQLHEEHQSHMSARSAHHKATLQARDNTHDATLRDFRSKVIDFEAGLHILRAENLQLQQSHHAQHATSHGSPPDIVRCRDIPASRVHATLNAMIPRERFALFPANNEIFVLSVPPVVTGATSGHHCDHARHGSFRLERTTTLFLRRARRTV